ncbi:MAG: hypothetical protein ACAI25_17110, partial [Planctomycetota bacterium]
RDVVRSDSSPQVLALAYGAGSLVVVRRGGAVYELRPDGQGQSPVHQFTREESAGLLGRATISPDGRHVGVCRDKKPRRQVEVIDLDAPGAEPAVVEAGGFDIDEIAITDGRRVYLAGTADKVRGVESALAPGPGAKAIARKENPPGQGLQAGDFHVLRVIAPDSVVMTRSSLTIYSGPGSEPVDGAPDVDAAPGLLAAPMAQRIFSVWGPASDRSRGSVPWDLRVHMAHEDLLARRFLEAEPLALAAWPDGSRAVLAMPVGGRNDRVDLRIHHLRESGSRVELGTGARVPLDGLALSFLPEVRLLAVSPDGEESAAATRAGAVYTIPVPVP